MPGLNSCMAVGLTDTLPMQVSEAAALERAVAAESSDVQLTQESQIYQTAIQEMCDSRDATAASHQQALQSLRDANNLAEVSFWCTLWCILY